jgi:hypothetical protein
MIWKSVAVAALSLALMSQAGAWNDLLNSVWGSKGNDTGGIIPWSPENEARSFEIASRNCAFWNKYPLATSILRTPGSYIVYKCVWDPPAVAAARRNRRVDAVVDK